MLNRKINSFQEKRPMQYIKTKHKVFSGILLGFLLFGLKEFAELIYHPLQSAIALIGLLFVFGSSFFFRYKKINPLKGNIKFIFYVYLLWIFFIIIRPALSGESYSDNSIHPYSSYGLSSYLLPLVVLLGINVISLQKLFKMIFLFSIIGFVFFVFNFNMMQAVVFRGETMTIDGEIGLGELANLYYFWFSISSLSLLCYEFVSTKYKWAAIFTNLFSLFLMAYFARRSGIFIFILYFFGMFYLYLDQSKSRYRIMKILFIFVILSIVYLIVENNSNSIFSILFDRLKQDTRSDVDETLIKYLTRENAWWFGKGIEGAYKHPGFDAPRYVHETGFLYLILKGGIIYLSLYVVLLLHAAYLGFFKTKNRFTQALALYIFFHIIFLIPFGLPSFSLEYLFVWIGFALCESSYYRTLSNMQFKNYLAKN